MGSALLILFNLLLSMSHISTGGKNTVIYYLRASFLQMKALKSKRAHFI